MEAGVPSRRGYDLPGPEFVPPKKKRQRRSTDVAEEAQERSKLSRFDRSGKENEESFAWKNLQLILSLQDKNADVLEKVDLAFDYVESSSIKDVDDTSQRLQVIDTSRTIVFLSNWVQSVLISSEKKTRLEENKPEFGTSGSFLDIRCWQILHFCLEESKKFHLSLTCSKDFLRVIHSIAMDASSCIYKQSCCEGTLSDGRLQFYDIVLDGLSLIFSSHGGVANENLDLWILLIDKVLELIVIIVSGQLDGSKLGNSIMRLSCCLLEPFAKYLKVHPIRKTGFHNFIDKLLEPLLQLLHALHSSSCGNKIEWRTNLSKSVEEVLAQGLFHSIHIDGFLSLQSTIRYRNSDSAAKEEKSVNKSYHRHLFDKVEKIVAKKADLALLGLGELLHLFVSCVAKHKGASVNRGPSLHLDISSISDFPTKFSHSRTITSERISVYHIMDAELRKSIFDFFVQILEYLLADLTKYLQSDKEVVSMLLNVSSTLRSINNLLASFICEKLYVRTDDTSDGASRNFLRFIYTRIMSWSAELGHQETSRFGLGEKLQRDLLISVRKELVVNVHHLLNIEYEVVGDDLESLWALALSSLPCCYDSTDLLDQSLLSSEILNLGCQLIDLYSELRQVDTSIFALCGAARRSLSFVRDSETVAPSSTCSPYSNSVRMLFCSSQFRLSLSNAFKAIPEGQVAGCIRQLSSDIRESLEWMKFGHQLDDSGDIIKSNQHSCNSQQFSLQAELLGNVLCEAYTIILDSVTVTSGNSYLVGASLKNLIDIIRPSLSSLVSLQPDGSKEFSILVDGRTFSESTGCDNLSMCWILVAFFRLLLSYRSLFRQAISLMAPDASRKMAGVIGDPFTAYSGRDWLEMTGYAGKGFFSWIFQPSATLLNVIHSVSRICIQDSVVLCSPLMYVLNAMALQRLLDLNGQIKSSDYVCQWNQNKLKDDGSLSSYHKRIRKWRKCISEMKNEAAGLTKFIMGILLSEARDQISTPSLDGGINGIRIQGMHANDALSFAIGSLDEKSLPFALWWIVCQNVDIWCSHAAKKDLKRFIKLLIWASVSCINDKDGHLRMHNFVKPGHQKKVIVDQIALEFMSNSITYEQRFVCRYMASSFCKILQKSVSSLFDTSGVDLSGSPDWIEVISTVENSSDGQVGALLWTKPDKVPAESSNKQINVEFATCQSLLTFLMRMPEEYFSFKSSSLYITSILNLERLLLGSLLWRRSATSAGNPYQIFQLFVTCRRVLWILAVASSKDHVNGSQPPLTCKLPEYKFPLLWLLKSLSVVIGFQHAFPEDTGLEAKAAIFSLLDHTSNVLLTVSKDQFKCAIGPLVSARKLHGERTNLNSTNEESNLSEYSFQLNRKENLDAQQSVLQLAEVLEEHLRKSHTNFKDACVENRVDFTGEFQDWNKLSMVISCCHGLLGGLASAFRGINTLNGNFRLKFSCYNTELMTRINSCIDTFVSFTAFVLKALFPQNNPTLYTLASVGNALRGTESSSGQDDGFSDASNEEHSTGKMFPSDTKDDCKKYNLNRESCPAIPDLEAFLTKVQHWELCLKKSLLLEVLNGENAEAAIFLRHLFIACSAILRLNLQIGLTSSSWSILPFVVNISQFLMLEFSRSENPHQFEFFWLDGVVKFLEELGNYFPLFDPSLSRDFYVKLIGLHLRVIGKCISLQGKEARLASQQTGSHTKQLTNRVLSCFSRGSSQLGELKERLRMSFKTYIKKSSEFHLLSAIQAVERALVGVQEALMTNYEIARVKSNGGEVSSVVAAGIDGLDMILEFVTGPKRLNMIRRHIQNLVACLYNIILHLQGPNIFYGCFDSIKAVTGPDSGSVIHMCIEVLTKISGKPSSFPIDGCYVAQSLRVPGALFQYFLQLQISEVPVKAASKISTNNISVDRKFSIELYAACCRMLCTALKHHRSETRPCIAILEDSVSVLLNCLEMVNINQVVGRDLFTWEVQEAVECASGLRRVYEEVRQQKDVYGQFSFRLLSCYIWVYCGFGLARKGIIREVDEALRPGLYALIDSCSPDDLQHLHTVFGEGPCRSTLAALQHDYKLNFQFEGKV